MIPPGCLPEVEGLRLEDLVVEDCLLRLTVATTAKEACCPLCAVPSHRVQSRYSRTVADLPWAGKSVRLLVQVRRFRCDNPLCPRVIFCERLGPAIAAYARRTQRLTAVLEKVGLALGGEAGARLLWHLGLQVSPAPLLRVLRRIGVPCQLTPGLLGVDEWAYRRRHRYGTILVDLEKHAVVDLLTDRDRATFERWLITHPDVQIISRDRASGYAEAIRAAAPHVPQVADRWHLLQNVAQALEALLHRHERTLVSASKAAGEPIQPLPRPQLRLTPAQQQRRAQVQDRYGQVQSLYEEGRSLQEIADLVGIDTNTLSSFVHSQPWGRTNRRQGRQPAHANLAPYLPYLHKRWKAGCQNGMQLWRELRARGSTGSASSVRPYIALLRQVPSDLLPYRTKTTKPPEPQTFSVRRVVWLTLSKPEHLSKEQAEELAQACHLHPQIDLAVTLVQDFVHLVRERKASALADWHQLAVASGIPELRQFARGLTRDWAAVTAALSTWISQGQVEGQIPRLKLIKRQMYGRGGLDLLRIRMVQAA